MRNIIKIIISCSLLCSALCGFGQTAKKPLIIVGDNSYPPFEYINDKGEPDGFNVELIKAVMSRIDMPYVIELDDWDKSLNRFLNKEADCMAGLIYSNNRAKSILFSTTHSTIIYQVIRRKGEFGSDLFDNLSDKTIIIPKGEIVVDILKSAGYDKHLKYVENMEQGLIMLSKGEGDIAITSDDVARLFIKKDKLNNLEIIDSEIPPMEYCIAFSSNDSLLLLANRVLISMKRDGSFNEIYDKWFPQEKRERQRMLTYIFVSSLIFIIMLLYTINIYTRRKIAKVSKRLDLGNTRYRTLFDNTIIGLEYYDKNGILIDLNNADCDIYGIKDKKKLIDSKISLFDNPYYKNLSQNGAEHIRTVIEYDLRKSVRDKYFALSTRDEILYVETEILPVRNDNGEIDSIVCTSYDVTKNHSYEEQLEESINKAKFAVKSANIAFWDFDTTTKQFITINDILADYDESRIMTPDNFHKAVHPDDAAKLTAVDRQMADKVNMPFTFDARFLYNDGIWHHCTISGVPFNIDSNNRVLRYVGFRKDNTYLIQIQEKLEEEKLKAQESDKLKSAFLANMSHEIRTPLNSIVGFSELLQDTTDENEKAEFINIINKNNDLLLRLIGDILDLSKIEAGLMELKPVEFNLTTVFQETFVAIKQRHTNQNIELKISNPFKKCIITLDKDRVMQICHNFMSNAIKYTKEGSITMGYEYKDKGIRIYVTDTGIGMTKEKQEKAFDRFEKLDDFAQGTGLGLSICKAIVEQCNGKIGVDSKEGKGSTFWAWIPCKAEIQYEDPIETNSTTNDKPATEISVPKADTCSILVAEDNDSNYMLVKVILKNYRLTRAYNGQQAVNLAKENKYDAILMDIKMPVMDGYEATREIRKFDQQVTIIALTANAFNSDKDMAIEAGCNAFIAKPLKKKELEDVLNTAVNNHKTE